MIIDFLILVLAPKYEESTAARGSIAFPIPHANPASTSWNPSIIFDAGGIRVGESQGEQRLS